VTVEGIEDPAGRVAVIRATAPHQLVRDHNGMAVAVQEEDIRERVRVGKVSVACVFVVDASGSMGATKRMESAKGAVLSMLLDSYRYRDRVGLVAFRGSSAEVLLPLCSNWNPVSLYHCERGVGRYRLSALDTPAEHRYIS
jgi:Mg-chelatase subunit ChlD